ncbi:acetylornithine deacetylase [Bacillus sp. LL01]|uniref:peptidase n=1 Tax=Bacillus sp. LL01 TaxID=1665556 RepID=UPI00064CDF4A|nr:peptidase [Bacillus sp. LL01]KMJ59635.1 acetylornithine deacetylase [Bacillus sp. LL01]
MKQNELKEWFNKNRGNAVKLLQKLIQERSVQGLESSAQAVVIEACRELGLEIDIWEPDAKKMSSHSNFVSAREHFHDSPNVVAVWKGTGGGRSIILNGHIDVVPEGDLLQWECDPFEGKVMDGKVFGRGSTDMKGGNVSLLFAINALKSTGVKLKGDVIFQSVIEEESGGAGTLAAILRGYTADAVLIPEPTNMKIFPKQQGSMWFKVKVKGRSAHGGTRYEGVSAIEKSILVIDKIKELETLRNSRVSDPLYKGIPIPLPINLGKIEGGSWPSSVPDLVILEGRIGVGPEEKLQDVKSELASCLSGLSEADPWFVKHPVELEWFGAQWVPGAVEVEHPFVKMLESAYTDVVNKPATMEASPWGTDGGLFTQLSGIPTVVFGPGTTEVAHYPNEFITIDQMMQAAEILAILLMGWCGTEDL